MDTITNYGMKSDAISSTPSMISSVTSSSSSSLDKLVHLDSQAATKFFHNPDQKLNFNLQRTAIGAERAFSRSSKPVNTQLSWDQNYSIFPHFENRLFSSSLSDLLSQKLELSSNNDTIVNHEEEEPFESLEEIEAQTIGNLLPDDGDLLSGVLDETEIFVQPSGENDLEDLDVFSSVGGMELGDDTPSVGQRHSDCLDNSNKHLNAANTSLNGEHPYGEHPSRTLFVRNINSNVEDSELQALFEQYGDIRSLYTACKHRGFVMISYFDIRAARTAMTELQNKPLRLRRLDIHYSIPKDNPSEKEVNQGTLLVFNLDSSVSDDDLHKIFGAYGEIKEVHGGDPCKNSQKLIEFYDSRAADEALHALNGSDIAGKKIKVELSCTGGFKQSSAQPVTLSKLEQEEPSQKTSAGISRGCMSSTNMESDIACGPNLRSFMESPMSHRISTSVSSGLPSLCRAESANSLVAPFEPGSSISRAKYEFQGLLAVYPRSLPEYEDGLANKLPSTISSLPKERSQSINLGRTSSLVDLCNGFATSGNGSGSLLEHHHMWSNSNHRQPPAFVWPQSPSMSNEFCSPQSQLHFHGLPRSPSHIMNSVLPMNSHHVGSAPAVVPSFWDRRNLYPGGSPEASSFFQGPLENMRLSGSPVKQMDFVSYFPHNGGNNMDVPISFTNVGLHGHRQRGIYRSRGPMHIVGTLEHPGERIRNHRSGNSSIQADNKRQYELDIGRIRRGEDNRTTLMIKNIPNKYTSKMLMATIDERHRGTYDFIYLPIDFKNKCNVGYAFINMVDPSHIIPLYEMLNGKKWEKFNSEKIASLAYARIQGKAALVSHFQNSSLMNEDKRCRPILFQSDGSNVGDQVPFPMSANSRSKSGRSRSINDEDGHNDSLPNSGSKEKPSCSD